MELRHLRYFAAVAELENVSRAAMRLHVSQPAVSRQIRDLEEELGLALLERGAKSVSLTRAGRVFLKETRAVLARAEAAVAAARAAAAGQGGEVRVGYAPTPTTRILPLILRAFQAEASAARVKLRDLSTEEMLSGLRKGLLDAALIVRPTVAMLRGLSFAEITRDPMRAAVAPSHPLARSRSVSIARLSEEPLVAYSRRQYPEYHKSLARLFRGAPRRPRIVEEHEGGAGIVAAVEAGTGVALTTDSLGCSVGPRVRLLPITPEPPAIVVGIAWPRLGATEATRRFVACARAVRL